MMRRALILVGFCLILAQVTLAQAPKTRLAVVGLDHDHVWGILKTIAGVGPANRSGPAVSPRSGRQTVAHGAPAGGRREPWERSITRERKPR